jgi:hypothetical protein
VWNYFLFNPEFAVGNGKLFLWQLMLYLDNVNVLQTPANVVNAQIMP